MKISKKYINNLIYISCILCIIVLSSIQRSPIFGKLEFIFTDTFYPNLKLLKELDSKVRNDSYIYSDVATQYTLHSLTGLKSNSTARVTELNLHPKKKLLELMNKSSKNENSLCVINLKGFPETWVPHVTLHWSPLISNTALFYEYNGYTGKKLAITLENLYKGKCVVYKNREIPWEKNETLRYHIPNLNYSVQQEDIHILQFKKPGKGKVFNILIDVGFAQQTREQLLDYLAVHEIYQIDSIYITHAHKDHYSGLFELIKFGMPIKKVWMNMPLKVNCDKEIPWGCDFADLIRLFNLMKEKGVTNEKIYHINPDKPRVLYKDDNNELSLLFASPPVNPQTGNVDINDLSMIMKLNANGIKYLFTGDLNDNLSNYLKKYPEIKADVLKVPHHGTEGVASNEFFDAVNPTIGIVPSPQHLWCSKRSSRIFNYFKEHKTKMYISGFHGDILIRHFLNGKYIISTSEQPDKICQ